MRRVAKKQNLGRPTIFRIEWRAAQARSPAYICPNPTACLNPPAVTDPEFDLLDELYFVTPFRTLLQKTGLPATELENQLRALLEQGLIRSYWPDPDTELAYETTSFGAIARDAAYLASKEGLLQHNTR